MIEGTEMQAPEGASLTLDSVGRAFAHLGMDFGSNFGGLVVSIEAELGVESLQAALDRLASRHLPLRCVFRDNPPRFVEENGRKCAAEITQHEGVFWEEVWHDVQVDRLQDGKSWFRVELLRFGGQPATEIMLLGHHVGGDAQSLLQVCKELLETLADPEKPLEERDWAPQISELISKLMPSFLHRYFFMGLSMVQIGSKLARKHAVMPNKRKTSDVDGNELNRTSTCSETLFIEKEVWAKVLKTCKETKTKTSVFSVIADAVAEASLHFADKSTGQCLLFVPADLRRVSKGIVTSEDLANLSTGFFLLHSVGKKSNNWTRAKRMTRALKGWSIMPVAQIFGSACFLVRTMESFTRGNEPPPLEFSAIVGSWGRLPIQGEYPGLGKITCVRPLFNVRSKSHVYSTVYTFDERCVISCSGPAHHFDQNLINDYARRVQSRLENFAR